MLSLSLSSWLRARIAETLLRQRAVKTAFTHPRFFGVPKLIVKDNGSDLKHLEEGWKRLSLLADIPIHDSDALPAKL